MVRCMKTCQNADEPHEKWTEVDSPRGTPAGEELWMSSLRSQSGRLELHVGSTVTAAGRVSSRRSAAITDGATKGAGSAVSLPELEVSKRYSWEGQGGIQK